MKLRVFHAGDGDCLLLSTDDRSHHMLIDGGREGTFTKYTLPELESLRLANKEVDIVCVSHIDDDHISGILRMVKNEVEWRKFEFDTATSSSAKEPKLIRPPRIGQIWHNALFHLVGQENEPRVESMLATTASLLAGSSDAGIVELASDYSNLATGQASSLELSRRISNKQLAIPVNTPAGGGVMKRGAAGAKIPFGNIDLLILGPSDDDIARLKTDWEKWLAKNQVAIDELHRRLVADERSLGVLTTALVANPIAAELGQGLSSITAPNLASLMLLVQDGNQTLLLTGDGESGEILLGLEHHLSLTAEDKIHVTALKVQHHGAIANVTNKFVERVTADHYIFCGNGAHHNPEIEVVKEFARRRMAHSQTEFQFWFTSSSKTPNLTDDYKAHMLEVERVVKKLKQESNGLMKATFISKGHFDLF